MRSDAPKSALEPRAVPFLFVPLLDCPRVYPVAALAAITNCPLAQPTPSPALMHGPAPHHAKAGGGAVGDGFGKILTRYL